MDEKQEEMARQKASLVQDYLQVFDGDEGQRVLLDLMEKGHILKPTSSVNGDRHSILNEGKRELILYILDMVTYDVKDIMDLIGTKETKKQNGGRSNEKEELFDFFESD